MLCPGDPERAADFARRAASVSHDGEAIYGAQVIAAMEAEAFVQRGIEELLDVGTRFIPRDSVISRLHDDLREWHAADDDWRKTLARVQEQYGYDTYGGNCHMVPNHALIVLGLLYGDGDFGRSLMIVNTSGWDTDCNSGNAGCILGIARGLDVFDGPYDWRGPVADRLYVSTAEGGATITDAVREADTIVAAARALAGEPVALPKGGARFHFSQPGSVQGFTSVDGSGVVLKNVLLNGTGEHLLSIYMDNNWPDFVRTAAFTPLDAFDVPGYGLSASPTLYPGQTIRARVIAASDNTSPLRVAFGISAYDVDDRIKSVFGPETLLIPGTSEILMWNVPNVAEKPIANVGIAWAPPETRNNTLLLDWLKWDGPPDVTFTRPDHDGTAWQRAWVNAVDQWDTRRVAFKLIQNRGTGMLIQGTREWTDYAVSATLTPHLCTAAGIAARVQGLRRHYTLLLQIGKGGNTLRLVRTCDGETTLAEVSFPWQFDRPYALRLEARGNHLRGFVDDRPLVDATDPDGAALVGGGVALVLTEGMLETDAVRVQRLSP